MFDKKLVSELSRGDIISDHRFCDWEVEVSAVSPVIQVDYLVPGRRLCLSGDFVVEFKLHYRHDEISRKRFSGDTVVNLAAIPTTVVVGIIEVREDVISVLVEVDRIEVYFPKGDRENTEALAQKVVQGWSQMTGRQGRLISFHPTRDPEDIQ